MTDADDVEGTSPVQNENHVLGMGDTSSIEEVEEREKKMSAYHESGHAVICHRLGGAGAPEIWRNTAQTF